MMHGENLKLMQCNVTVLIVSIVKGHNRVPMAHSFALSDHLIICFYCTKLSPYKMH